MDKLLLVLLWLIAIGTLYLGYYRADTVGIVLMISSGVIGGGVAFMWKLYPVFKVSAQLRTELQEGGYAKLDKAFLKSLSHALSGSILKGEEDLCKLFVTEAYGKSVGFAEIYCGIYNLSGQGFHAGLFSATRLHNASFPYEVVMIRSSTHAPTLQQKYSFPKGDAGIADLPEECHAILERFEYCDVQLCGAWLIVDCADFHKALPYLRLGETARVIPFREVEKLSQLLTEGPNKAAEHNGPKRAEVNR